MLLHQTLTEDQFKRLQVANKIHKFGALQTWHELFIYQLSCGDLNQIKQIGKFAERRNKKENITLPLKDYGAQDYE